MHASGLVSYRLLGQGLEVGDQKHKQIRDREAQSPTREARVLPEIANDLKC
jgi:hypothetical protein